VLLQAAKDANIAKIKGQCVEQVGLSGSEQQPALRGWLPMLQLQLRCDARCAAGSCSGALN
jgi:hypothetical protein